jgi:uncharacterized protein (UPF0332 family)
MMFDWTEYYRLAQNLVRDKATFSTEEACCRAAVSRAYYAAYCLARNRARASSKLNLRGTADDHKTVEAYYRDARDPDRKKIGALLDRLRDHRNQADYDDEIPSVVNLTTISMNNAQKLIDALNALT